MTCGSRSSASSPTKPRTTQELAPLLRLTDSAVSKHLHRLSEAGVVTSRRDGYYVLYGLQEDRLDAVTDALRAFVHGGSGRRTVPAAGAPPAALALDVEGGREPRFALRTAPAHLAGALRAGRGSSASFSSK